MSAASLDAVLARLAVPGIALGWREIAAGDEASLLRDEAEAFSGLEVAVRRRSGSARIVARRLLARYGLPQASLVRARGTAPAWPAGVTGSLAHDDTHAAAAVARVADFQSIGIDIEPNVALPREAIDLVATAGERRRYGADILASRLLFAAKEAVYKAVNPLDGAFLDFADIDIDLAAEVALVSSGRQVAIKAASGSHVVALAYIA